MLACIMHCSTRTFSRTGAVPRWNRSNQKRLKQQYFYVVFQFPQRWETRWLVCDVLFFDNRSAKVDELFITGSYMFARGVVSSSTLIW